eukprot:766689-Hanusia_phi.AAC.4
MRKEGSVVRNGKRGDDVLIRLVYWLPTTTSYNVDDLPQVSSLMMRSEDEDGLRKGEEGAREGAREGLIVS